MPHPTRRPAHLGQHSRSSSHTGIAKLGPSTHLPSGLGMATITTNGGPSTTAKREKRKSVDNTSLVTKEKERDTSQHHLRRTSQTNASHLTGNNTRQPPSPSRPPPATSAASGSRKKANPTQRPNFSLATDDNDDEWVSSSGAETPNNVSDHDGSSSPSESDSENGHAKANTVGVGTPRADMFQRARDKEREEVRRDARYSSHSTERRDNISIPPPPSQIRDKPARLPRLDTRSTITPLNILPQSDSPLQPRKLSPARSQPDLSHKLVPTSPLPSPRKSQTRPPSVRSITSRSSHFTTASRPHPLIRGHSFQGGPRRDHDDDIASGKPAAAVVSFTGSETVVGSPSDSLGSLDREREMALSKSAVLPPPSPSRPGSSRQERVRTLSSASTLSLTKALGTVGAGERRLSTALSSHGPNTAPHNRTSWYFPGAGLLGMSMSSLNLGPLSPAPSRPNTPPLLIGKLPPPHEGMATYDEQGNLVEDTPEEEKASQMRMPMLVWLPKPFLEEHLTVVRGYRQ